MVKHDDTTRTRADVASDTLVDDSRLPGAADRVGRYELLGELGRGGMGVVHRGRDPELDRPLAIKVVAATRSRSKQKLLDEARAMAKLRHPNVITVFDAETIGGRDLVAMELVEGSNMAAWLASAFTVTSCRAPAA